MRRILTFLTAIVLLLVSLGVGVFTADLPFWRRAFQLPLPADGAYLPVAVIGTPAPPPAPGADRGRAGDRRAGGRGSRQPRGRRRLARLVSHVPRRARRRALFPDRRRAHPAARLAGGAAARRHGHRHRARRRPDRRPRRPGRALPARVGRRAARPHHAAPAARGNQRARDRRRHRAGCCIARRGATWRAAGLRHLARRAHVVRQRFRIERARLQARSRAGRFLQRLAGQHAARRGHHRTRHRTSRTKLSWTSACGGRWARDSPSCSSIGAPACPPRIAAGARPRATCCAS